MPLTSLFNILTKTQSWLWWFYFIGGLGWPHKSDLYAPTLPPTVWQSDSRKVQNVHLQDKWALKLLLYRALFLFFLSSTPIRPLSDFFLLLPLSSFYSLSLFTLVRPPLHPSFLSCSHRLVLPSRLWSQDFFSLTTCHLSVWLHLTLLSHYRCDLSPFTASTLIGTLTALCCSADLLKEEKRNLSSSSARLVFKLLGN